MHPVQDPQREVSACISRLFVYPVKSCAGVEVQEAVLTETGLDLDRAWMVVDSQGEFVTQREHPRLALVKPQLKMHDLVLRAPGMLALHVNIDAVEQPATVKVWDDVVQAYDMGDIAAQWFTDFLSLTDAGLPAANANKYRLVRFDPDCRRLSSMKWTKGVESLNQFSDGFPLLVLSSSALDDLNSRLNADGKPPVGIERFRPNIVLSGMEAHDEDRMDEMHIQTGDDTREAVLRLVKPCKRCPIPDIDPATSFSNHDVSDAMQGYRQNTLMDGAVTFGMNAIVITGVDEVLRVGQRVSADFSFQ